MGSQRQSYGSSLKISRLEQAKALLSSAGTAAIKSKPGRPPETASVIIPKVRKTKKRRKMSAEARERIRQAQIKRWAAVTQAGKPNTDAAAAPSSKPKKRAAKTAAKTVA
jgi:hypothetical protein